MKGVNRLESIGEECSRMGFKIYFDQMIKINKSAALRMLLLDEYERDLIFNSLNGETTQLEFINKTEEGSVFLINKLRLKEEDVIEFISYLIQIAKKASLIRPEGSYNELNEFKNNLYHIEKLKVLDNFYGVPNKISSNYQKFLQNQNKKLFEEVQTKVNQELNENRINQNRSDVLSGKPKSNLKTITISFNDENIRKEVVNILRPLINDNFEKLSLATALEGKTLVSMIRINKPASYIVDLFSHHNEEKNIAAPNNYSLIKWICENFKYWNTQENRYKNINIHTCEKYFYKRKEKGSDSNL